jgi:hypothetical protein
MRPIIVLVGTWVLLAAVTVSADTRVEIVQRSDGEENTQTIFLVPGKMRAEAAHGGQPGYVLFDQAKRTLYVVNPEERSYLEMDPASMAEMQNQMQGVMAQAMKEMEARMKDMPPEQRERMAAMLSGMPGHAAAPSDPVRFETTSVQKDINGYSCTRVDAFRGEKKVREMWITSAQALEIPDADYQTVVAMQEMAKSLASQFGQGMVPDLATPSLKGLPVKVVHFDDSGSPESEQELKSVSHEVLDAALFQIPSDYQKRSMPTRGRQK